jgi:hypothetical protein
VQQTQIMRRLHERLQIVEASASPDGQDVGNRNSPPRKAPEASIRSDRKDLPKPAFLVPAIIEALRASTTWKPVVEVVPGEADAFCSADVKAHGGTILTGDSDLLIQDLGPSGSVVFLDDMKNMHDNDSGVPKVYKHCLTELEERLGLDKGGGLLRLAYEFSHTRTRWSDGLDEAVRNAKEQYDSRTLTSESYVEFCESHLPEEYIHESEPIVPILSDLDPRISEFVIQSLNIEVERPRPDKQWLRRGQPRGPEEVSIWLPVMIADPSRRSCWSMSEPIRQIAYGIAQPLQPLGSDKRRQRLIEYRTLESKVGGRAIGIPGPSGVFELRNHWLGVMDKLQNTKRPWLSLALYQDVAWSMAEDREPISLSLAQKSMHINGEVTSYNWESVHFVSQVQASLYSLRILKQTLSALAQLNPEAFSKASTWTPLRERLEELPPIDQWATVEDLPILLKEFMEDDGVSKLAAVLEVDVESLLPREPTRRPKRPLAEWSRTADDAKRAGRSASNRFSVLGESD